MSIFSYYSGSERTLQAWFAPKDEKSAAHVYDTGGAFGLISYKRLHQTGRAGGTLLPLLNEVADGEARAGFPSVLHI